VSIANNIAEGYGKSTKGECRLFLGHARGSNFEVATQLVIASGLGFASPVALQQTEALCEEVGKMLVAITKKLEA
jgi:four helix bundle protein